MKKPEPKPMLGRGEISMAIRLNRYVNYVWAVRQRSMTFDDVIER
ncbi:hypothetical protein ACTGJ9_037745 [Bradyrhizobium sp. RDM12]